MAKKELSEKQKEVLEKYSFKNKPRAVRSKLGAKGAERTNQIKAEKKSREEGNIFIWDRYFSTADKMDEFWEQLSPKDKASILMAILPKDKQVNEIIGNLGVKKEFITAEEVKATDRLIEQTYNEQ